MGHSRTTRRHRSWSYTTTHGHRPTGAVASSSSSGSGRVRRRRQTTQVLRQRRLPACFDVLYNLHSFGEDGAIFVRGLHGIRRVHGFEAFNGAVEDYEKVRRVSEHPLVPCRVIGRGEAVEGDLCLRKLDEDGEWKARNLGQRNGEENIIPRAERTEARVEGVDALALGHSSFE